MRMMKMRMTRITRRDEYKGDKDEDEDNKDEQG